MGQARQRIEEIKEQQSKRIRESNPPTPETGGAHGRPQYFIALGGIAVGLMIAAVIWLTKPLVTEDKHESNHTEAAEVISSAEIRKTNDNIARLNQSMEMLAETISNMDVKFKRILVMAESMTDAENKNAYTLQEFPTDPVVKASEFDGNNSVISRVDNAVHETKQTFAPTHTVNVRLNLRPTATFNSRPITTLKVGTEVQYISQSDGWDYVNTRLHGKGWCSSGNLSPLLQTQ
jgi:hypothetical protein